MIQENRGNSGDRLRELIEKLTPDQLYSGYHTDRTLTISFIYDPLEADLISESAIEHWNYFIDTGEALE